jgi:hydroxymethylbilane synthase
VFAAALREALLAGDVDAVVHSFKDLPTAPFPGLSIAAVPKRADARDALCARDGLTLASLPPGSVIGTGSPRRRAQLLSRRSDLEVVELRGNVDTRLGRVGSDDPERRLDAVVLAAAGLDRIGRVDAITEYFGIDGWPTAPAQGALAVETRTGDEKSVAKVDHKPSRLTAELERAVLAMLEAGCSAPIGAHAIFDDGLLFLDARVYREDGSEYLTSSHALYPEDSLDPVGELAKRVTDQLLASGAAELAPLAASRDILGPGGTE